MIVRVKSNIRILKLESVYNVLSLFIEILIVIEIICSSLSRYRFSIIAQAYKFCNSYIANASHKL